VQDANTTLGADPLLTEQVQNLRSRISNDPTQAAIRAATVGIEDNLATMLQRNRERAAAMGGSGGGGEIEGAQNLEDAAKRDIARASTDIALNRQDAIDRLILGGSTIMAAPGQREILGRQLRQGSLAQAGAAASNIAGNQQAAQQFGANLAQVEAEMAMQQQQAMLQLYNSLWR
jgi:hypothetical protein